MSELSKLFRWSREVKIVDASGVPLLDKNNKDIKVFLRLVGDNDFREARDLALRNSRKMRLRLRSDTTDEHKAQFADIEKIPQDELIFAIATAEISDFRDDGLLEMGEVTYPEVSDSPTLEEQEEHQVAIDNINKERVEKLTQLITERGEKRRIELKDKTDEDLRTLYVSAIVNSRALEEFAIVLREYCVYKGTFSDKKFTTLAFDSFEDFESCSPQLKRQLMATYTDLEVTGEELKN